MRTAIVWFRRDLRVHDHPALRLGAQAFDRVVPVFVLDDALLEGRYRSPARARFMLACLAELDEALRERGSGLVVRHGRPERELPALAAEHGAEAVLWTADVSPYASGRDARVTEALRTAGVRAEPQLGTYIADPTAFKPYSVFARFHRAWAEVPRREVTGAPGRIPGDVAPTGVPSPEDLGIAQGVPDPVRPPGERAARAALDAWLGDDGVDRYGERSNGMARVHTSRLSPYFRWGCLSPLEAEQRALRHAGGGARSWVRELAWRDFYAHTLDAHPENVRVEQQERFRGELAYEDAPERLAAWQEGRTGFPLVDAGMRELAATGWMHNRVRLVAGSLLTKELHLDWRAGEEHFARLLLDGEPAQNNGNWQWIAGTGTDPAPYFRRMYNPALHQERFDPHGEYVRRWVPELGTPDYPEPVVDRKAERERAMERYRRATAGRRP